MKLSIIIFRTVIIILGFLLISFDALLYRFCERQKSKVDIIKNQQQIEVKINSNRFTYQEGKIEELSKNLEDANQQIKDQKDALEGQKDALLQEVEKRQQIESESKIVQTSLVDIKAEADAIKQDMKEWQKDYVNVLAQLEKKMDDSQVEIKSLKDDLDTFEKTIHSPDNSMTNETQAPDKNTQADIQ